MKKLFIGILFFSSISTFAEEYKSSCSWLFLMENGGVPTQSAEMGEKLIQSLAKKNSDAGFPKIVSVNSHLLSNSKYAQYCVTSKKRVLGLGFDSTNNN